MSRINGIGLVVDPGTGTYVSESDRCDRTRHGSGNFSAWLELLGWNRDLDSLAGTGQELDWRVGSMGSDSSWIRELELMFLSRIDVIGLVDPGTSLLSWSGLAGTGTSTAWLEQDRNWTGESDRWDRTRRGSRNWNLCF